MLVNNHGIPYGDYWLTVATLGGVTAPPVKR
jgi:hypothetical protein